MPQTNANMFAADSGIVIGIGVTVLPQAFIIMLPAMLRPFVSTGIVMGFLAAAVMHIVFNVILRTCEIEEKRSEPPPKPS